MPNNYVKQPIIIILLIYYIISL